MTDEDTSDPRMKLTTKDMPKYPGVNRCLVGETRNHFPDGKFEQRFERGIKKDEQP